MKVHIIACVVLVLSVVCCGTTKGTKSSPDPYCPPSDEVTRYRYRGSCSVYWQCDNGVKYKIHCPEGLEFSVDTQECDAPEIANCELIPDDDPTDTTPTTETTTAYICTSTATPNECISTSDTSTTNTATTSSTVTIPTGPPSTTTTTTSPTTTTTSPTTTSTTEQTSTTSPTTTGSSTITTTTGPEPNCPNNTVITYFPYPDDCTMYWECFGGQSYLYVCPNGLWWHEAISKCDYPGPYCSESTSTTQTTGGNDPRCSEGGVSYWPEPDNCHEYVECIDGVSYLETCPPNYQSDRLKQCVTESQSECCQTLECIS